VEIFFDDIYQQSNEIPAHIQPPLPQVPHLDFPRDPFEPKIQSISVNAPLNSAANTPIIDLPSKKLSSDLSPNSLLADDDFDDVTSNTKNTCPVYTTQGKLPAK
jgi:hypothetical protein